MGSRAGRSARAARGSTVRHVRYGMGRAAYGRGTAHRGDAFGTAMVGVFSFAVVGCFIALVLGITYLASSPSSGIARSTVKREKLAPQYVTETGWYTDELGWIDSERELAAGMRSFYEATGVQPYLYITDTVNGTTSPSDEDMAAYAQALYDELFTDEGHILLLFYEYNSDSDYKTRYVCGAMAKVVMDDEACDILLDYIDHYYFSNLEDDEMFSQAFQKAGERIMSVTRSPVPLVILAVAVLLIAILAFVWWTKSVEQRNREAEQRERILTVDIGSAEDPALKDLEEKYKNPE